MLNSKFNSLFYSSFQRFILNFILSFVLTFNFLFHLLFILNFKFCFILYFNCSFFLSMFHSQFLSLFYSSLQRLFLISECSLFEANTRRHDRRATTRYFDTSRHENGIIQKPVGSPVKFRYITFNVSLFLKAKGYDTTNKHDFNLSCFRYFNISPRRYEHSRNQPL